MSYMKLKPNHLYEIHWLDITHNTDWIKYDNLNKEIEKAETDYVITRWTFLEETKELYVFTSGVSAKDKDFYDVITMPKGVIKNIKLIK